MKEYITMGKVTNIDFKSLSNWLSSEEGSKYFDWNWSPQATGWDKSEKINFYEKQMKLPKFNMIESFYDQMKDPWLREEKIKTLQDRANYLKSINQSFDLIYQDLEHAFSVIRSNEDVWLFPDCFLEIKLFKSYDNCTVSELTKLQGDHMNEKILPAKLDDISLNDLKHEKEIKLEEIENAKANIESVKKEQLEEIEKIKREIEEKYKVQFMILEKKKAELQEAKEQLEKQLYVLETEIYGIRCYNGEVVNFTQITTGKNESTESPVVIYQKLRYIDVELGKHVALYDIDGDDITYFEQCLKNRSDILDLFSPPGKSISIVRISENGVRFCRSERYANMLEKYEKIHGKQLGILVRNGGNVWMGWTDDDHISIHDGYLFYEPKKTEINEQTEDEIFYRKTGVEEKVSRYFLFSVLQGIFDNGNMLPLPEKVSVLKGSPYLVYSMADGWIADNRFGSFADIVKKTDQPLMVGDSILTTQTITRDDIYTLNGNFINRSNEAFNNDRGRGNRNRTHDVSISNCTVYPVNKIDCYDIYTLNILEYPMRAIEKRTPAAYNKNCWYITYTYKELQGPPKIVHEDITIENGYLFHNEWKIKKHTQKEFMKELAAAYRCNGECSMDVFEKKACKRVLRSVELEYTKKKEYVSEEKQDSGWKTGKKAKANMQIRHGEYLNLTFLNSVWVEYVIMNEKIGNWKIGGYVVDYSMAIKYLNCALKYLKEREKQEKELLVPYINLSGEWQVALSEFKLKYGYHSLTETRAKKFAKEYQTS